MPKKEEKGLARYDTYTQNVMTKNGHPVIIEVDKLINVVVDEDNSISSV